MQAHACCWPCCPGPFSSRCARQASCVSKCLGADHAKGCRPLCQKDCQSGVSTPHLLLHLLHVKVVELASDARDRA